MFGGRFSLIRFGLRGETQTETKISVLFVERIRSLISAGENVIIEKEFRERCNSNVTLTRGISVEQNFTENIGAVVGMVKDYLFFANYAEKILSDVWLAGNIEITQDFAELINSNIFLAKNTPVFHEYAENIFGSVILGKNTPIVHEFRESVFAITMATLLEKFSFIVSATVNPGEELRIDSEIFTAMIGSRNVIHQYSGDWLTIDRNTLNVQINGNLSGLLVYVERYL